MDVAALYVLAKSSPYRLIEGVDLWPESRDALLYRGPHPVVVHAPCGPHSRAVKHRTKMSLTQGPHLAPAAVLQVRKWGGVLEHPKRSLLWEKMSLPYPLAYGTSPMLAPRDTFGGFTIELRQVDFGHLAEKRTWCYFVGVDPARIVLPMRREPAPAKRLSLRQRRSSEKAYPRCSMDLMSAEARKRSPEAFARWLVDLARTARRP